MASSSADGDDDAPEQEIRLVSDGEWWVATDVETGVTSQGETREAALENLDEAVALYRERSANPSTAPKRNARSYATWGSIPTRSNGPARRPTDCRSSWTDILPRLTP